MLFLAVLLITFCNSAYSSQLSNFYLKHRYPTDSSLHVNFQSSYTTSNANFVSTRLTAPLNNNSKLEIFKNYLQVEYQANRKASMGLRFTFDHLKWSDGTTTNSRSGLSDQYLFTEYRFLDKVGSSLSASAIIKFPLYKNQNTGTPTQAPLGDAQTDFSLLLNGEHWFSNLVRGNLDFGYTFRSEGFSAEIPFLFSIAFVTHKVDFSVNFLGNLSLANDQFTSTSAGLKTLIGDSEYALAKNPWLLLINPSVDLWINPSLALNIQYQKTLVGSTAPSFQQFSLGVIYRWYKVKRKQIKRFKEVPIETDLEENRFISD